MPHSLASAAGRANEVAGQPTWLRVKGLAGDYRQPGGLEEQMSEPRDRWGKVEVIVQTLSALGSIAIPVALFVVGNRITERQQQDSEMQIQADRVEKMLGHLASDSGDERKLAIRVLQYFSNQHEFPAELVPVLVDVASTDSRKDVAATASAALENVAHAPPSDVSAAAQKGLSTLPVRVNVQAPPKDPTAAAATASLSGNGVVVAAGQSSEQPASNELRYYRQEDAAQAHQIAGRLSKQGIAADVKDFSSSVGQGPVRPKSFDLVVGKQ